MPDDELLDYLRDLLSGDPTESQRKTLMLWKEKLDAHKSLTLSEESRLLKWWDERFGGNYDQ